MRRLATAVIATFLLTLFGPVAVALASASEQAGSTDNPVTGASASNGTNGGTAPDTGGGGDGGGGQAAGGGATSTAQSDNNGPAEGPSHVQGSNAPTQDTTSTSDATVENGAAVDQSSGQGVIGTGNEHGNGAASPQPDAYGQGQGQGQGNGNGNANGNGNGYGQGNGQGDGNGQGNGNANGHANGVGQGQQQAHAGQQANAGAAAVTSGSTNEANTVLVGPAAAGDNGGTLQANTATAAADATATQEATQGSGSATATQGETTSQAGAEQSATATAQAQATDPENVAITTRIEAPGNDGPVEQSNVISANAEAVTHSQGSDTTQQQANATAQSQLENPANVAVEVRVFSDGDTTGGQQINSSSADSNTITDGGAGQATAEATLTNPNNTFVSIRVNSEGLTGAVEQENTSQESANGVISATSDVDHTTAWSGVDAESGISVGLTTDGDNTDLRITVDNSTLDRPSEGTTFTWTWDLVIAEDGLACDVQSSSAAGRVDWNFDCDPNNVITREPGSGPTPVAGAISWNWDWSRPDLEGWDWNRLDAIALPDCSGCTYVIDFRWITLEPVAPAAASVSTAAPAGLPASFTVRQSNTATATASASTDSGISQELIQTSEENSERSQTALQQAVVVQSVTAIAGAELRNARNSVVISHGLASQWNWAEAVVSADAAALIRQQAAQHQGGIGSVQLQAVLQSAQFTQLVTAVVAATVRDGSNRTISRNGNGIQSTSSKALGNGRAGASAEQQIVQVQFGNESEQLQVAGQWAIVVQHVDLGAASALAIGLNGTRLDSDTMNQRIGVDSTSRNTASAEITQSAIQVQDADGLPQSQESLQLAHVRQVGVALAQTSAGRIEHSYSTPPAAPPVIDAESIETVSTVAGTTRIVVIDSSGATEISVGGVPAPTALPAQPAIVNLPSLDGGAEETRAPATVFTFSQSLAPTHDPFARVKGAEAADGSSPRFPGRAPERLGATAASAGNGGPGALAALTALTLIRLPQRGRRLFSPAGRRPAVALLRRERPG
jgi:hypothetical protein